ncbi:hypothetical protein L4D09_21445 [Photobacterium makurazakiensis]|uniref:hypothetical protein n=1 Tax=Photobacterium makurazakiensis TaxID=2910234 RepID=UPI003D0BF5A8
MNYKASLLYACSGVGILMLTGCESSSEFTPDNNYLNLTMPLSSTGLSDVSIAELVDEKILQPEGLSLAKDNIGYQQGKADLNGDGQHEAFVLMQDRYFCGSGGCTAYIFDGDGNVLSQMSVTKMPILVADTEQNGWRDIIVWSNGAYRQLMHDGNAYPSNPSVQPVFERESEQRRAMGKVMASELYQQDGYELMSVENEVILESVRQYHFTFKHYGDQQFLYHAAVNAAEGTLEIEQKAVR